MNHGLSNDYLYSACMITCTFKDDIGTLKTIRGTAFFICNDDNSISLVTNKHCVDLNHKQSDARYSKFNLAQLLIHSKVKDQKTNLPSSSNDLLVLNYSDVKVHANFQNDVACINKINVVDYLKPESKNIRIDYFIPKYFLADKNKIEVELSVCDFVAFPGYPPWYDQRNNLPILRTGTIASDPRYNYSWTKNDEGDCIAYEAFSFGGSSGSPVFAVQKGIKTGSGLTGGNFRELMLIGINAGHLNTDGPDKHHSGISYLYKSTIILELLDM